MLKPRQLFNVIKRYYSADTSSLAFWWLPLAEGCGNYRLTQGAPCDYYLDFSAKARYTLHLDARGVIQLDYKGDIGLRYNPCAVAQYGLGHFSEYLKTGSTQHLERARAQGDWLCANLIAGPRGEGRWEYHFGNEGFPDIELPFISAIAQGQGVSLLLRLFAQSGEDRYLDTAHAAFLPFLAAVREGGVINRDRHGRLYLEELPTAKVSCVLDGFIYAMFGVYDYYQLTSNTDAERIFGECTSTLREILPDFDLGFWSRCDCLMDNYKMPSSFFYHNVHVQQLKAMHVLTGEELFRRYAVKWESYQRSPLCRALAFGYKAVSKVVFY